MFTVICTNSRGGGVGIYIKEKTVAKYNIRDDIINLEPTLEHLWIEVEGKNKNSNILLCVVYQSSFDSIGKKVWIDKMDSVLSQVTSVWSGTLIHHW